MNEYRYSEAEIAALERAMRERRDMRHFRPDPLPEELVTRLLTAAHLAPSVGFMQPWRFIRITDAELRTRIQALVEEDSRKPAGAGALRLRRWCSKTDGGRGLVEQRLRIDGRVRENGARGIGEQTR
ncbi:MAG: nitroreductase family protein [Hydrogenophilus sp.]|nr:nitroreductase family protein [Hydrogenophilus sp.]